MKKANILNYFTKDKVPFIAGGVVAGALGLWVVGKITSPLISPYIKDACRSYLGEDMNAMRQQNQPAVVEMARMNRGKITKRINTVGLLHANAEVTLRSEMAGRIKEIHFKEGEQVSKGDVLIVFEDADLRAALEGAAAELKLRQNDYERSKQLQARKIESNKKFDEAIAQFEAAKAQVDKAQAALDKATILAPFDGVIGLIDIDPGAYVQAAQDLVKIVDNSPIYADFKIPEKNLHDIGVGQLAEIKLDAFPDERFTATVEAIDSSVDSVSHSIAVRATIPNDDGKLRSGLYANVSLIIGEKTDALLVPESALIRDGNRELIYVVHEGRAQLVPVVTGTRENAMVEILTNLREGLNVVTAGQIKIYSGKAVTTQGPKPEEALKSLATGTKKSEDSEDKANQDKSSLNNKDSKSSAPSTASQTKTAEASKTPPEESKGEVKKETSAAAPTPSPTSSDSKAEKTE
ncbi:efflux RND transporter periplasmic adaptor subunit [Candidatus Odyssella thessalonicensis]|uniref:efflux RND transporter periplasmic adaptor subunit n=1 Tax=Candidatus Odyssella thessalonicensis TaxID=84647 RepID=UPI000225B1B5|nr:efflux RND transporter periplasmic adaptor subunit [Candidatus Odyssella thessalonicensis]